MAQKCRLSRRHFLKNFGALAACAALPGVTSQSRTARLAGPKYGTFSIVAFDPTIQAWGVAVTSKFVAVGAVVPWVGINAESDPLIGGALATQAYTDIRAAEVGFKLLLNGSTAQDALAAILDTYHPKYKRENYQFGLVDSSGNTAAFTGESNPGWAGHTEGEGFTVQGNTLAGPEVLAAVVDSYTTSTEAFWFRLLNALKAGEEAGGDRRRVGLDAVANSAAIKIAAPNTSALGETMLLMDLRADNDPAPIDRLEELMNIWLSAINPVPTPP